MSGMIVALTIGFVPGLLVYLKKTGLRKNYLFLTLAILSPLILYPAKELNYYNKEKLGFDSHALYTKPNYNQQSLLWGEHFVESTKGKMLLLSTLGSPGYALPIKPLIHSARDFSVQFESFIDWSRENKVNAHAFVCGIFGIITLIFSGNKKLNSSIFKLIFTNTPLKLKKWVIIDEFNNETSVLLQNLVSGKKYPHTLFFPEDFGDVNDN